MSDFVYILSTATVGSRYRNYLPNKGEGPNAYSREIVIHGGTNITGFNKPWGDQQISEQGIPMYTPRGVVTKIRAADFEWLKELKGFKTGLERKIFTILEKDPGQDHSKVAEIVEKKQMLKTDASAPLNNERVLAKANVKPAKVVVGKPAEED